MTAKAVKQRKFIWAWEPSSKNEEPYFGDAVYDSVEAALKDIGVDADMTNHGWRAQIYELVRTVEVNAQVNVKLVEVK